MASVWSVPSVHGTFDRRKAKVYAVTMTSDSEGNCTGASPSIFGYVVRIVTNPGETAPEANWDLTLLDGDGVDILGSAGLNRAAAASEQTFPIAPDGATHGIPVRVHGPLTAVGASMGDTRTAVVNIYVVE